jgi:hypothetical protein
MDRRLRLLGNQLGLAVHSALGQSGDLVLEQLLSLLPDADVLPILEAEQTWEQVCAESLRRFARKQTGQVVNADHAEGQTVTTLRKGNRHGRLAEGGIDVVDGNRVVRVGGVTRHVANNAQAARLSGQRLGVDEGRDLGGEVDAVDKDIRLDDLLVWARLSGGLLDIPLDDILKARTDAEVDGTATATTESANNENARVVAGLSLAFLDGLLDVFDEEVFVLVAGDTGKRLVLAVLELPGPSQECEGGTSETGVVAECCNTAAVLILEELKIEKCTLALRETTEDGVPTTLALVACRMSVLMLKASYEQQRRETNSVRIERATLKSVITIIK